MEYCLLVIDMQKGIFGLKQPIYDKDSLIGNVRLALGYAREKGVNVIFSRHENATFLKRGTEGCEIVNGLETQADLVIMKKHADVFNGTGLDDILKKEGISSVIIAGLISNGCVRAACLSALNKGYKVILLGDAHSTFYKDAAKIVERINREMEEAGARIADANELYALL
jgi:nicotinamidase-related amidase